MFKVRPNVIADIYDAIEEIVFMSELNGVRASVTFLDDRFKANKMVMIWALNILNQVKKLTVYCCLYTGLHKVWFIYLFKAFKVKAWLIYLFDRYQHPRGQYRDILVLFKIHGYACELQININEILIIKEGLGHKQYEFIRNSLSIILNFRVRCLHNMQTKESPRS